MVIRSLARLGFTDSEIKVYSALLDLDTSTVGPITSRAGVSASKIYEVLDKLQRKGLVSHTIKNNVKHFRASDPENIVLLLNEREEDLREQKKYLQEHILPQIRLRHQASDERQDATVYESVEGVRAALNLILEELGFGETYCTFFLPDIVNNEHLLRVFLQFHRNRVERGIGVRNIIPAVHQHAMESLGIGPGAQVRITDQKLPVGVFIFKNRVMMLVAGATPTVFVIYSSAYFEQYQEFFNHVWQHSTPLHVPAGKHV